LPSSLENSRKIFHTPGPGLESVTKLKAGQVSPGFVTGLFVQIYYSLHFFFFKLNHWGEKGRGEGENVKESRARVCLRQGGARLQPSAPLHAPAATNRLTASNVGQFGGREKKTEEKKR